MFEDTGHVEDNFRSDLRRLYSYFPLCLYLYVYVWKDVDT